MSDAKLRDLERRWKETGSPDDEAAYLLERVRVGDLSRERLELAAYGAHRAAMLALGEKQPNVPTRPDLWLRGLQRWGLRPALIAVVRAMREAMPRWNVSRNDSRPDAVLVAVDAWLSCPCPAHAQECERAGVDAEAAAREAAPDIRVMSIADAAGFVGLATSRSRRDGTLSLSVNDLAMACKSLVRAGLSPDDLAGAFACAVVDFAFALPR